VEKRIRSLVEDGAVNACVVVSKTESKKALDNLARCMHAFCGEERYVGRIISEGGVKLLITLFKECTAEGKIKAAHGLARLGAHSDPDEAFHGQRAFEVVKPMVELLHPEVDGRANYDALLTLTNLASKKDEKGNQLRRRILKEKAIPRAEEFWFDTSHEFLRAAAAEFLLNMLSLDEFFKQMIEVCASVGDSILLNLCLIQPGSDRVKLWVLYCAEDQERLQLASSAGFAVLTGDEGVCARILEEIKSWPELLPELAMSEHPEVQYRCLMVSAMLCLCLVTHHHNFQAIANMVASSEKVASELMAVSNENLLIFYHQHPNFRRNFFDSSSLLLSWTLVMTEERVPRRKLKGR